MAHRSAEEDLGLAIERLWDRLQLDRRLREVDELDVGAPQGGHLAPPALVRRVDRMEAEARCENAVECRRRAAPLDVAEDSCAGLVAGPLLDLALQPVRDPAETDMAERVRRSAVR